MRFYLLKQKVQHEFLTLLFMKTSLQLAKAKNDLSKRKVSIAIPVSIVSDVPHLREKTSKVGLIGRAAAIFRVNEIIVYPDNPHVNQAADTDLIATLLAYMDTPQYLRKKLFTLKPELRYAGVLPPLRTPHHPLNRKMNKLKVGEYREGVTLSKRMNGVFCRHRRRKTSIHSEHETVNG